MKTRTPKTKVVTGCNDCPFSDQYIHDQVAYCNMQNDAGNIIHMYDNLASTPSWCPLKTQPIIVTYET